MASKYPPGYRSKTVPREFKGGREHETTDKDEIPCLRSEVCQNYSAKLADEDEHTLSRGTSMKDAENALDEAIDKNLGKDIYSASSTTERVGNVSRFARGQHISMPGKYSDLVTYRHHAIVCNVIEGSGTRATLELIEFNKKHSKINIYKSKKTFDLKDDDVCISEYKHLRYTADEIVQRAESMLPKNMTDKCKFGSYNPAFNNCEHFATWCVLNKGHSSQVRDIGKTIYRNIRNIWLDHSTFLIALAASYLIIKFVVPLIPPLDIISIVLQSILTAIYLQLFVPKINRMLQLQVTGDKKEIRILSEIDVGDVISMEYFGMPHNMIVTEVSEQNKSKGKIQCVHYGVPFWNIFGKRKMFEEWFQVDLTKDVISKYDCRNLRTYKKDVVVNQARQRIDQRR